MDNTAMSKKKQKIDREQSAAIVHETTKQSATVGKESLEHRLASDIINAIDAMIYATDPETCEILFVNDNMKRHYGIDNDVTGELCYKVFVADMDERCPYCPCKRLDKDPGSTIVWEEHSTKTNRIYRNTDRYIDWVDDKKIHIQHSVDITEIINSQETL